MRRQPFALASAIATLALAGISSGCQAILNIPDPVAAHLWCLNADPARGRRADNLWLIDIKHPDGIWMRGCKCYCPADHAIMVEGADGALTPGSGDALWYEAQAGQLRATAVDACTDRAAQLEAENGTLITFDDPGTVSCLDSVADEAPYYASQCVLDEDHCPPGAPGGFGTDGYIPGTSTDGATADDSTTSDDGVDSSGTGDATADGDSTTGSGAGIYGIDDWSTVIDCPTHDRCDVDAAFVAALRTDLRVFSEDHIGVQPGKSRLGHQGFVLTELGPDSFPAALGLQPGDVLWRLNGIALETLADVGHAFEVLDQATVLTADIDRGSRTITRSYHRVDLARHP
jgi:hypothetical protein